MSQQLHEVDVTAAVEPLWKLQTPGVDVLVPSLLDESNNGNVLVLNDHVPFIRENDLEIYDIHIHNNSHYMLQ